MSTSYFPQLSPGSVAQYPISRSWSKSAATNTLTGGNRIVMTSSRPARVVWQLFYAGLSEAEWGSLQTLFDSVEGRFGTFTFLDPTDNLLSSSEDLTAAIWSNDPLLQIGGGGRDPLGGEAASKLANTAQAPQRCMQEIEAASDFVYAFSVYLRSDAACTAYLIRACEGNESRQAIEIGTQWERAISSGAWGTRQDGIRFGLELPAGVAVYAFGPQVEAQPCAGPYKKKLGRSGVYLNSRFDQDELVQTATASGQYSTEIRITSLY